MVRILIVDDHPLVSRSLTQLMSGEFPGSVVAEAPSEAEALAAVWSQPWNLVVLDLSLPGRGGIELLKEIKAARPKLPVLIFSTYPEAQFAKRSLRAGASGYVTKESTPEQLLQAARQVTAGGVYVSQIVAEILATDLGSDQSKPPHELLSDREYDVMLRLGAGQGVSQVAETLNLSVKTVSTYRTRILEKMSLANNAELTQYALRNKLIE
jgi:two-component system invasion response regulator UvrY